MKTITVDNNEKAYECKSNPNYYITESGDIYSILVKGGRGKKI